ncbi:hypothetical protein [Streptomyces griseus]|uniref:hypothetical protein n=1 Tax=Streptomyces griseus TaxID=1911 RepID=UPI00379C61D2
MTTPMTPDQPTPVELTEQQLDALSAAGNRALNDHYHESQCHCDAWPTSCVSSGNYFMGAWDTSAFDIGLPAVLAVWETLRTDRGAAKVAELLAEVDRLRKALSEAADQVAELESDLGGTSAENAQLRARVAELTVAPVDEAVEMAEAEADLEAMRREHSAPCRVPDSPDCTCPPEAWGTPAPRAVKRARPRNPRTCSRCGDTPAQWCPDCEACRLGCFATRAANPCTHPNAPWNTEITP